MSGDLDRDLDDIVAVASARACAEAHATYYTTLIEHGMPDDLAAELTSRFTELPTSVWVIEPDD